MTAADISTLPDSAFVAPARRELSHLEHATRAARRALRYFHAGEIEAFVSEISRAHLLLGMAPTLTPSWRRVCGVLARISVRCGGRLMVRPEVRRG
jgi:hypothetical protein